MNLITHVIVGLAVSESLMLSTITVIIGAIIPDLDCLLGIPHRTVTHSMIFLITLSLLAWRFKGRKQGLALFVGLISHLMLDSITIMGIPLLYPLNKYFSFNLTTSNNFSFNIGFIILSIILLINKDSIHEFFLSLRQGVALKGVFIFSLLWFILLLFFPVDFYLKINNIKSLLSLTSESRVMINGSICSNVSLRSVKSGNEFQVFDLCDETGNITVWKLRSVLENNLSFNDFIQLNARFTTKFGKPELYYVSSVIK